MGCPEKVWWKELISWGKAWLLCLMSSYLAFAELWWKARNIYGQNSEMLYNEDLSWKAKNLLDREE